VSDDHTPGLDHPAPPLLQVVRGTPDAEELAAVVAVVAARGTASGDDATGRPLSVWAARSRLVRPPLRPSAGAWRASAWPR